MVTFPVSLIPTFFVPLFMLVHVLTFLADRPHGAVMKTGVPRFRVSWAERGLQ